MSSHKRQPCWGVSIECAQRASVLECRECVDPVNTDSMCPRDKTLYPPPNKYSLPPSVFSLSLFLFLRKKKENVLCSCGRRARERWPGPACCPAVEPTLLLSTQKSGEEEKCVVGHIDKSTTTAKILDSFIETDGRVMRIGGGFGGEGSKYRKGNLVPKLSQQTECLC